MALIGKAASQRNLCDLQVAAGQERLRLSNADSPHIFADRAAEMAMELAADLDGMPPGTTRKFRESDTGVLLFPQYFSNAQQQAARPGPPRRAGQVRRVSES
jgi:hypothetical protein